MGPKDPLAWAKRPASDIAAREVLALAKTDRRFAQIARILLGPGQRISTAGRWKPPLPVLSSCGSATAGRTKSIAALPQPLRQSMPPQSGEESISADKL